MKVIDDKKILKAEHMRLYQWMNLRECRRCWVGTDRQLPRTGAVDPHHPQVFSPPPSARSLCAQNALRVVFSIYF